MTIFVEDTAREVNIPDARRVKHLEEWTGGDVLVSTLSLPILNQSLLAQHIEDNALVIQIKFGDDLASSVGDRLNDSLARMHTLNAVQAQMCLLFVGVMTCDVQDRALINGRVTHSNASYWQVQGALDKWCQRGGVVHSISRESLLPKWCEEQEKHLKEYALHPWKYVYGSSDYPDELPHSDDPLQLPVRVRDGRVLLRQLPGLGIELVERVWAYAGDTKSCLRLLTDTRSAGMVEGIGQGKIKAIRKYLGLSEDDGPLEVYTQEQVPA